MPGERASDFETAGIAGLNWIDPEDLVLSVLTGLVHARAELDKMAKDYKRLGTTDVADQHYQLSIEAQREAQSHAMLLETLLPQGYGERWLNSVKFTFHRNQHPSQTT